MSTYFSRIRYLNPVLIYYVTSLNCFNCMLQRHVHASATAFAFTQRKGKAVAVSSDYFTWTCSQNLVPVPPLPFTLFECTLHLPTHLRPLVHTGRGNMSVRPSMGGLTRLLLYHFMDFSLPLQSDRVRVQRTSRSKSLLRVGRHSRKVRLRSGILRECQKGSVSTVSGKWWKNKTLVGVTKTLMCLNLTFTASLSRMVLRRGGRHAGRWFTRLRLKVNAMP